MMEKEALRKAWLEEEAIAQIHGWDFSHIHGRYEEETDLPWDYAQIVRQYLSPEKKLLDIDTGGAEFLLSLGHPYGNTSATEAFPPNVELCRQKLLPLGVDFREADAEGPLPFADETFDLVINRHGNFQETEIHRILRPGGVFVTQQVGAENDRELVELLLPQLPPIPFPDQYLSRRKTALQQAGLEILQAQEAFRPIRFWDVGAFVWFAHIIEWEFPGFRVEKSLSRLYHAQEKLEQEGCIEGRIHRFLLAARKPQLSPASGA